MTNIGGQDPSQPPHDPSNPPSAQPPVAVAPSAPDVASILKSLAGMGIAYAATVGATVVLLIVAVTGAAIGGTESSEIRPDESEGESSIWFLLLPLHLAAMGLGGRLSVGGDGAGAGIFALPLILTALFVGLLHVLARRAEKARPSSSIGQGLATSAISAGAFAIVLNVFLLITALRWEDATLHSASFTLFFGALAFAFAGDFTGRARAAGMSLLPAVWRAGVSTWLVSVAVFSILALPVLLVFGTIESGIGWVGAFPSIALNMALGGYLLGHQVPWSGFGETVWLWSDSLITALVATAFALIGLLGAAVAWHLRVRRSPDYLATPASWIVLPATYAGGALLLTLLTAIQAGGAVAGFGGSMTLHSSLVGPLFMAAWGLVTEALARTVAPAVAAVLPGWVTARLGGSKPPVLVGVSEVDQAGAIAPVATRSPEQQRRDRKVLILIAGGVAALIAVIGTFQFVSSKLFGPEGTAETYLDALVDKDLDTVVEMSGELDDDEADDSLLTQEIFDKATSTITDYEITDLTTLDGTAYLTVEFEGLDTEEDAESRISLVRDGRKWGLFPQWRVESPGVIRDHSLDIWTDNPTFSLNSVVTEADPDQDAYWLLPGTYEFDAYGGNEWVESNPTDVVVAPNGLFSLSFPTFPSSSDDAVPSEKAQEAIDEQLNAYLEECMASDELEPEGCPNEVWAYGDLRNVEWELTVTPELDYGFDGSFPADLDFREGKATATWEENTSYSGPKKWEKQSETADLYFSTTADIVDGELVLEFEAW